nr:MAG TPA: hypothetical protein [Caudoviricetes sp.]
MLSIIILFIITYLSTTHCSRGIHFSIHTV